MELISCSLERVGLPFTIFERADMEIPFPPLRLLISLARDSMLQPLSFILLVMFMI